MKNVVRGFLCGLAAVALLAAPACRPKKPKVIPTTATTARTETTATVPPVETKVATDTDFVRTDTAPEVTVRTEGLSEDIDEANRMAQDRGLIQDAYFGYDETTLSSQAQAALTSSANWLRQNRQYNLLLEGHCDERGTEQYNLALGDRRANTAREYLVTLGVDGSRIRTVSYGEERPFDDGHDESSWARNRRAHLVLVGTR